MQFISQLMNVFQWNWDTKYCWIQPKTISLKIQSCSKNGVNQIKRKRVHSVAQMFRKAHEQGFFPLHSCVNIQMANTNCNLNCNRSFRMKCYVLFITSMPHFSLNQFFITMKITIFLPRTLFKSKIHKCRLIAGTVISKSVRFLSSFSLCTL